MGGAAGMTDERTLEEISDALTDLQKHVLKNKKHSFEIRTQCTHLFQSARIGFLRGIFIDFFKKLFLPCCGE